MSLANSAGPRVRCRMSDAFCRSASSGCMRKIGQCGSSTFSGIDPMSESCSPNAKFELVDVAGVLQCELIEKTDNTVSSTCWSRRGMTPSRPMSPRLVSTWPWIRNSFTTQSSEYPHFETMVRARRSGIQQLPFAGAHLVRPLSSMPSE